MDALRLIKTARHALAEARSVPDALHEAWQAGLLTEAIGGRIAEREPEELGTLGQLLCDAGGHAASCLDQPPEAESDGPGGEWSGGGRVDRLDELGELEPVLVELGALLHEVSETLVVLACGADVESLYWCCIDGVDAGAECKDLVAELLRTVRGRAGAEEPDDDAALRDGSETLDGSAELGDLAELGSLEALDGLERSAGPDGPDRSGAAVPVRRAERALPKLVVPLGPPVVAACGQPRAEVSAAVASATAAATVGASAVSARPVASPARAAEERRSSSSPARSVLIEASSSCICSSRVLGVAGAPAADMADGSDQGSDTRRPLQLGGAV